MLYMYILIIDRWTGPRPQRLFLVRTPWSSIPESLVSWIAKLTHIQAGFGGVIQIRTSLNHPLSFLSKHKFAAFDAVGPLLLSSLSCQSLHLQYISIPFCPGIFIFSNPIVVVVFSLSLSDMIETLVSLFSKNEDLSSSIHLKIRKTTIRNSSNNQCRWVNDLKKEREREERDRLLTLLIMMVVEKLGLGVMCVWNTRQEGKWLRTETFDGQGDGRSGWVGVMCCGRNSAH